jgi:hypothetical protein
MEVVVTEEPPEPLLDLAAEESLNIAESLEKVCALFSEIWCVFAVKTVL